MNPPDVPSSPSSRPHPSRLLGRKIVKPAFQYRFAFTVLVFLIGAVLTLWLAGWVSIEGMRSSGLLTDPAAVAEVQYHNQRVFMDTIWIMVLVWICALAYSHFLAGPLYRFEKTMDEIQKGDLSARVHLRKWDEFKEIADQFNLMMDQIEGAPHPKKPLGNPPGN